MAARTRVSHVLSGIRVKRWQAACTITRGPRQPLPHPAGGRTVSAAHPPRRAAPPTTAAIPGESSGINRPLRHTCGQVNGDERLAQPRIAIQQRDLSQRDAPSATASLPAFRQRVADNDRSKLVLIRQTCPLLRLWACLAIVGQVWRLSAVRAARPGQSQPANAPAPPPARHRRVPKRDASAGPPVTLSPSVSLRAVPRALPRCATPRRPPAAPPADEVVYLVFSPAAPQQQPGEVFGRLVALPLARPVAHQERRRRDLRHRAQQLGPERRPARPAPSPSSQRTTSPLGWIDGGAIVWQPVERSSMSIPRWARTSPGLWPPSPTRGGTGRPAWPSGAMLLLGLALALPLALPLAPLSSRGGAGGEGGRHIPNFAVAGIFPCSPVSGNPIPIVAGGVARPPGNQPRRRE